MVVSKRFLYAEACSCTHTRTNKRKTHNKYEKITSRREHCVPYAVQFRESESVVAPALSSLVVRSLFCSFHFIFMRFHFILYLHSFELDPDDLFECRHREWKQQRLFLYTLFAMLVLRSCRDHLWRHRSANKMERKERMRPSKRLWLFGVLCVKMPKLKVCLCEYIERRPRHCWGMENGANALCCASKISKNISMASVSLCSSFDFCYTRKIIVCNFPHCSK